LLIVVDIYPAGEAPIEGVNTENLVERIKRAGHNNVVYKKDSESAVEYVVSHLHDRDIVLTLGAGNIWKLGEEILNTLKVKST